MTFKVLTVCTGNICRSPAAAAMLRYAVDDSVDVSSAGSAAMVGHTVPHQMAGLVMTSGADTSGFSARQATPELIADADLVLALTTRHRSWVVSELPSAVRRTLTLREFGRLVSTIAHESFDPSMFPNDGARLAALVPLALLERPKHAGHRNDDDVVDPYGRSAGTYRDSFEQITIGLAPVLRALSVN